MNTRKAKVAWSEVCIPRCEVGLGFKSIKEANVVSVLKLIWHVVSEQPSLWVKWVRIMLIGKNCFWSIKENSTKCSWMWRKFLKYRDTAKRFHRVEVCDGNSTSFWFDKLSPLGRVYELTGPRGSIDIGISLSDTIADAVRRRPRKHKVPFLNDTEEAIDKIRHGLNHGHDQALWKFSDNGYKIRFETKTTWNLIREKRETTAWYKGVWFSHATPKYSFFVWLAINN